MECDFCGWATKNNVRCTDGLTILQNAFEGNNGGRVPLVWMHDHSDPTNTIGHADLENRDEGVYAYGYFNDSEKAKAAKAAVLNGDVTSMSIFAGHVRKNGNYVTHGDIKEVSLVLAGANPGARIENVIKHSDGDFEEEECDLYLDMGEGIGFFQHSDDEEEQTEETHEEPQDNEEHEEEISHAEDDNETVEDVVKTFSEKQKKVLYYLIGEAIKNAKGKTVEHSDDSEEGEEISHADGEEGSPDNETVEDVVNGMSEKQKKVMYFLIGKAVEEKKNGGKNDMEIKHNVFEAEDGIYEAAPISHADQAMILNNMKNSGVGTFQNALHNYLSEHEEYSDIIQHGWEDVTQLFPDWHDVMGKGAPEAIPEDIAWVATVMRGVTKSPFSRIRTRQADINAIKAGGYPAKGTKKHDTGTISMVTRTTDPQTIYIKDKMDRDDIIDITDFDVVAYMQGLMRQALEEEIARAILIGDGREPGTEDKISEEHIRSIWNDDDLYSMHFDVDFKKAKEEIQGTNTKVDFGDNYIRTEAFIEAALYSREKYKGRGKPVMFCEPHMINTMLMARDLNGRRIYNTVTDLAAALNVSAIHTIEEFAGKTRKVNQDGMKTKKLLAIFVNLSDYQVGATKGGQISSFNDFDIDYNQQKFLQETRLSGALTRVKSAIVLEEDVTV